MKYTINMLSKADTVEGQGVMSATLEQIRLVQQGLRKKFAISVNKVSTADITHYHTLNPQYFLCLPAVKRKGKTVCSVHFLPETVEGSLKIPKLAATVFYQYIIRFYKSMDHLVVVNPYFITLLKQYGISEKKVTYIPNFVSEKDFFQMESGKKQGLRKKYGLHPHKFTVLSVGQLQTRKGVFDFIEVAKKMPEIQFVWAGGFSFGGITDGYGAIKKIMEHPPENVKFLGIVKREKMNEIYNLADVMALLSVEELFPMTILESMNCNIPILLRDLEIYEDILFDFYLKETSVDGFIQMLTKLKQEEIFYKNACNLAWKGHEFYAKDHVLQLWDLFYTKVVKHETSI